MKEIWFRLRWFFLDWLGERYTWKTDLGHGNIDMVDGWMFRGKFFTCDPEVKI